MPCVAAGEVIPVDPPGGTIATGTHVGPCEKLVDTYNELMAWLAQEKLVPSDPVLEPDASKWRTQIFWPVSAAGVTVSA